MNTKTGTLYGIGVGPGDPELIPLKSVRILGGVDVVFTASSAKNDYSLAVSTARPHIPETTPVVMLPFPMTKDKEETRKAWKENAERIIRELEAGKNAAFLTVGDSMTYSTYGYVLKNVKSLAPHIKIQSIPGISSYQAAAARVNIPLVEGEEALLITSGVKGGDRLREFSDKTENIVLFKAYRNTEDILSALEEADLIESSVGVSNCSLPDEEVMEDIRMLREKAPEYWTLIISKRKKM